MGQPQPQQQAQQGQFVNPNAGPAQGVIQQQQQQQMLQHRQRQQQIIQNHISTLSIEERQQFTRMDAKEKQQYLSSRNLLLPQQWSNGQQVQLQRHTIQLTEQQRVVLENMNPQQRAIYLNKLRTEKEAQLRQQQQQMMQQRQQMLLQQQQQQQQQHGGQQQMMMAQGRQPMVMGGQQQQVMMQQPQQQMIQPQQQPGMMPQQMNQQGMVPMQQQPQQWAGATPTSGYPQHSSPAPMSPIQQMGNLSPGHSHLWLPTAQL